MKVKQIAVINQRKTWVLSAEGDLWLLTEEMHKNNGKREPHWVMERVFNNIENNQ